MKDRVKYIVDLPDNSAGDKYATVQAATLTHIMRNCGKLTIVFVFNNSNVVYARGADMLEIVTSLARCMNGTAMLD